MVMSYTHGQLVLFSILAASWIMTALIVSVLSKFRGGGSVIRDQGPAHHKAKGKTPSTGGRAFLVVMVFVGLPGAALMNDPEAIIAVTAGILAGLIGVADDLMKISTGHSSGLKARYKLPLQAIVALMICGAISYFLDNNIIHIPFTDISINIGYWKILSGSLIFLSIVNAVNFTDGLDGLAASTILIASLSLGVVFYVSNLSTAAVPVLLIGICAGFLPFNWNPAKIFMGDSGALALGGALGAAAIASGFEIAILFIGIVFVVEIASVVLQVVYFRLTGGKRIFRMTPIHHALELRGFSEPKIVIGASLLGIIGGAIGLVSVLKNG
jgi:phospho-N-acetylmuramoyl-pentapeptide-transferase